MNPANLSRSCYCTNCHARYAVPVATDLVELRCTRCAKERFVWGDGPPTSWRNVLGAAIGALLGGLCGGPPAAIVGGLLGFLVASSPGLAAVPPME